MKRIPFTYSLKDQLVLHFREKRSLIRTIIRTTQELVLEFNSYLVYYFLELRTCTVLGQSTPTGL